MYCPRCGAANEDAARFCSACGAALSTAGQQAQGPESQAPDQGSPQQAAQVSSTYQQPYQQQHQPQYQAPQYRPATAYGTTPSIPSYMGWAIAVLILCFWPTGIAAVVYASQVGNKLALGDIAGAQESSRKAKLWCWISFGIAIAVWVIVIIIWVIAAAALITIY